jgi:hypothetical protein
VNPGATKPEPSSYYARAEIVPDLPAVRFPSPPTTILPRSTYTDRAKGFSIATGPLAAATGFVVLLIGIVAFGVPVLSVAALLLAFGGFCAAWLVAYLAHILISPDGALFAHVILTWQYLREEQRERHQRYREVSRRERD